MAVKCAWAAIDERGKATGGKAGDQTGRETKVGNWYDFGQTTVLRWLDSEFAKKCAEAMKYMCTELNVGYDQGGRTSIFNALKKVNWDYTKISKTTPLESDCSELAACAVNCAVGKAVIPSYAYTGNLNTLCMNTGYFKKLTGTKYCDSSDYLAEGDLVNKPGKHVIVSLENGPKNGAKSDTSKVAQPTLRKGKTGSEVKKLQANLNTLGITDADGEKLKEDGVFGTSTREAVKKFQKEFGLTEDGIYGQKSYAMMKGLIEGTEVAQPTLKKGSKGIEVSTLQANLNKLGITDADGKKLEVDGDFGSSTEEAVEKFQKKYGLIEDGIYGQKSCNKMKSVIK